MDAAEADSDVKLYKASGELLAELQTKLPLLVRNRKNGRNRRWVLTTKTYNLMRILDTFQEWPQLLDPILAGLVQILVDAFLWYSTQESDEYVKVPSAGRTDLEPLPRSICRVLYVLCKVRGQKIILRLLNNEPKYVEPIIRSLRTWNSMNSDTAVRMVWEEKYVMLLWLSHLMLAPFELSSISGVSLVEDDNIPPLLKAQPLPSVSKTILSLGITHLGVPSKDREAAGMLIVRLALRGDMQRCSMPLLLGRWCIEKLLQSNNRADKSQYEHIGVLNLLFRLINSASDSEAAPFVMDTFQAAYTLATSADSSHVDIRSSAPSRKLLVKIIRSSMKHTISLAAKAPSHNAESIDSMLENGIGVLLDWLGDTDTPVRQSASKALSIVAFNLDDSMSTEVIEAVLDSLAENVLLEDRRTGNLISTNSLSEVDASLYKKNLNAVDPLKWHGATLTLGHLLFRRSPPVHLLQQIVEALLIGLRFEQRSNVGTSIGVSVRDAACFGIWSLARKYSTNELSQISVSASTLSAGASASATSQSALQSIATELVISACFDPSGNLRRGSSAALQELIGRHPDAIVHGIPIVQIVDYHAVARRSRAVIEVSAEAAKLDPVYQNPLLGSLLDWRGVRATDSNSRKDAAFAVGSLFHICDTNMRKTFAKELVSQLTDLRPSNVGSTAAARQGLLCAFAAVIATQLEPKHQQPQLINVFYPVLMDLTHLAGDIEGRTTPDLVNVFDAVSRVVYAAACSASLQDSERWAKWRQSIVGLLHRCTVASEDATLASSAAEANRAVFNLLDTQEKRDLLVQWLNPARNKKTEYTSRGRIHSLGLMYPVITNTPSCAAMGAEVIKYFVAIVNGNFSIDTKVNAMQSIQNVWECIDLQNEQQHQQLFDAMKSGLSDYTIDQRGDVGSLLRIATLDAVSVCTNRFSNTDRVRELFSFVTRIAAEKLTKARFEAWKCLEVFWMQHIAEPVIAATFNHQTDVSSARYYLNLAQLLEIPWLQQQLVIGFISSEGGGTDEIGRSCGEGIASFLLHQSPDTARTLVTSMIEVVVEHMKTISNQDDREVIPTIDFLSFLIEQFSYMVDKYVRAKGEMIFNLLSALQNQAASIQRMEAILRSYSALTLVPGLQTQALDNLSRKLLHKWPKIRGLAADCIFLCAQSDSLISVDWNASPASNKAQVVALRQKLGIAASSAKKK